MSYWFAEPHTSALPGVQIDLRNLQECGLLVPRHSECDLLNAGLQ
jgi:hypothetical protein